MQIKSDRIVFPDNTEQFTASGVTLESLGIPNHDKVTVGDTGILGGISKVNLVKDGNDSAAYTAKTNLGHFGFGVGVGTAKNCFNVYDYTASAERMRIESDGTVAIPSLGQKALNSQMGLVISHQCPSTTTDNASLDVYSGHGSNDNILIAKFANGSDGARLKVATSGRVDINGSLFVNGTPKSLEVMLSDVETKLADRDKIIDKLLAKVEALEEKLKKVK